MWSWTSFLKCIYVWYTCNLHTSSTLMCRCKCTCILMHVQAQSWCVQWIVLDHLATYSVRQGLLIELQSRVTSQLAQGILSLPSQLRNIGWPQYTYVASRDLNNQPSHSLLGSNQFNHWAISQSLNWFWALVFASIKYEECLIPTTAMKILWRINGKVIQST